MKRVAIYHRISTAKQDTGNQLRELEAVAERSGWDIVRNYEDAGFSGAKARDKRPGLDSMMRAVNAKRFDMVAAWSVDRLGRSLIDLLGILQGLQEKGIDLSLHQQGLDTSTTAGKAMFQMLGLFAEFERGIIRERANAGLARARQNGTKLGRRKVKPSVEATIRELRAKADGILKIARAQRLGGNAVGLAQFETRSLKGRNGKQVFVTATPARHGPLGVDAGDVVGFALGVEKPGDLIYITGDTLWFEGTANVARRLSPKVVVLYTGSAEPRGRFRMTMGSEDALEAAHAFPDSALLSVHNEGWAHLRENQDQLADVFAKFNLADRLTRFERGKPLALSW